MKPKTYQIKPYRVVYRVWDDWKKTFVFETDDRKVLHDTYRKDYWNIPYAKSIYDEPQPRFIIYNQYGELCDFNAFLKEFREPYAPHRRGRDRAPDVRYKKGNPNKIKRGYYEWARFWYGVSGWHQPYDWYEVPYKVNGVYRAVRTTNEIRQNAAHEHDIGPQYVRRSRSARSLPSSWDDKSNSAQRSIKSWKTHSKRRKQWKV
jgi:hypothetical protein